MKNGVVFFLLLILLCILQTSIFPRVFAAFDHHSIFSFLAGHTLDLLLLFLIYLGMHRDRWGTLIWIFLISAVASAFGLAWSGAAVASFLVVGLLCSFVSPHLLLENGTMVLIFVAIMSLIEAPVHLEMGAILARTSGIFQGVWGFLLVQVVLNAIAAPVIFWGFGNLDRMSGVTTRRRRGDLLL